MDPRNKASDQTMARIHYTNRKCIKVTPNLVFNAQWGKCFNGNYTVPTAEAINIKIPCVMCLLIQPSVVLTPWKLHVTKLQPNTPSNTLAEQSTNEDVGTLPQAILSSD
jgi:hypothetical protein